MYGTQKYDKAVVVYRTDERGIAVTVTGGGTVRSDAEDMANDDIRFELTEAFFKEHSETLFRKSIEAFFRIGTVIAFDYIQFTLLSNEGLLSQGCTEHRITIPKYLENLGFVTKVLLIENELERRFSNASGVYWKIKDDDFIVLVKN